MNLFQVNSEDILQLVVLLVAFFALIVGAISYWQSRRLTNELKKREKEAQRRVYELAILKELGERIGYSLDVQKIIDIIVGSLKQFIEYTAVSYMLLEPEKIIFKMQLEKSVARSFVEDVRDRMLQSLSALLDKEFTKDEVEEVLSGAMIIDELKEPVRSFFNIPLVIGEKVVGVLTVAHTETGLYKEEETTILYKITKQASDAVTHLQAVVETEQRKLGSMVESLLEGVAMVDTEYRLMVINPAARQMIGLVDKGDITLFDMTSAFDGMFDLRGKLQEAIHMDKVLTIDEVVIRDQVYQVFVSPVKSSSGLKKGEILGGVAIFHDITQKKAAERMREDFTSMIVHELRSPLDGVKKMTEALMEDDSIRENKESFTEYAQMMHEGAGNMLELVNDLLDVAKLEAGKFEIHKEPTDVRDAIETRINFFKTSAKANKIKLSSIVDTQVPDQISFDPYRISQVLNNLISNALKFTDPGGEVTIHALAHKVGGDIAFEAKQAGIVWKIRGDEKKLAEIPNALVLAVTDSGIGISSDNISDLFSKFKQIKLRAKRKEKKGTGLGLSIVKGIVEAHEGKVGVVSEQGMGSTFFVVLPTGSKQEQSLEEESPVMESKKEEVEKQESAT